VTQDCEQQTQQPPFTLQNTHRRQQADRFDAYSSHFRKSRFGRGNLQHASMRSCICFLPTASTPLFFPSRLTAKIFLIPVITVSCRHGYVRRVQRQAATARRSEPRRVRRPIKPNNTAPTQYIVAIVNLPLTQAFGNENYMPVRSLDPLAGTWRTFG
jgi:hypothetical protein